MENSKGAVAKKLLLAVGVVGLVGGTLYYVGAESVSKADEAALMGIRDAYRDALNQVGQSGSKAIDEFLTQHVASDFKATVVSGQEVSGVNQYREYLGKMRQFIGLDRSAGPRGRYELQDINTLARFGSGDMAVSVGTTKEFVQGVRVEGKTATLAEPLSFTSFWVAVLKKNEGHWRLQWAYAVPTSGISPERLAKIRDLTNKAMKKG